MKIRVTSVLDALETWLGALVFAAMFSAIVLQVFFRYVLGSPLVWPFEFSVFCYIYLVYIGAVMAARRDSHVSFGILFERLPERAGILIGAAANSLVAVVFVSLIPSSMDYIRMVGGVPSSALGIPWGAVLAAFPLGMGIMAITLLARAVRDVRRLLPEAGE